MSHYFSEKQDSPLNLGLLKITGIRKMDLEIYTASGIFSWKKLDRGTRILIEKMDVGGKFLDLGCGIGIVGIVAAKLGADVTLSDVNERALKVSRMNVKKLGLKAKVAKSDLYEKLGSFDVIASNPPISAGADLCFRLIDESIDHLNPDGKLFLVARHRILGRALMERMNDVFGNCEVLGKSGGFWVYCSKKIKA
jgi:16S rRNA G1207 methylase RsmC